MWPGYLGEIYLTEYRIEANPGSAPMCVSNHIAPVLKTLTQRGCKFDELLMQKVIEPASGEWTSPVFLVSKPNGSLRFCVDYRTLNEIMVTDYYPH